MQTNDEQTLTGPVEAIVSQQFEVWIICTRKPEPPSIADEDVATAIAEALFVDVNMDDVYWTPDEREMVVNAMAGMIMKRKSAADLIYHLWRDQPPIDDRGNRGAFPFGYDGLQYPNSKINAIVQGVMEEKMKAYGERYGT